MARRGAGVKVRAIRGLAQRMTTTSCWERVRQQTPHLVLADARKLAPTPWTPAGGPRSLGEWARPAAQARPSLTLTPPLRRAMLRATPRGATDGPLEPLP